MPEPNLPPLRVNLSTKVDHPDVISVPLVQESIPELPEQSRKNLIEQYQLRPETAIQLVNEPVLLDNFMLLTKDRQRSPTKVANLLINDLMTVLNKAKIDATECPITTRQLTEVTDLLLQKKINLETCREILNDLAEKPDAEKSPLNMLAERRLSLVVDEGQISKRCREVLDNNPKLVKQYKDGKVKVFIALLGILAKNAGNKIDMAQASKMLEELLKK